MSRESAEAQARAEAGQRVLIIKLSALGDFIHAFHAFAAIRARHAKAHISLLTTPAFADLAAASPWFDAVEIDPRAPWWDFAAQAALRPKLQGFDLVYDLQTSSRSARYFRLAGRPAWSGIAKGARFPHRNPARDHIHTLERQRDQLRVAGVTAFPTPDRQWLISRGETHGVTPPFAMFVIGGAGKGNPKRWPSDHYLELARRFVARGVRPVLIGAQLELDIAGKIEAAVPGVVNLAGKTSLADLARLGSETALALGNDSGPLQLAASVGAPTLALFSHHTRPAEVAPRGPSGEWAEVLREPDLAMLSVDRVADKAFAMMGRA